MSARHHRLLYGGRELELVCSTRDARLRVGTGGSEEVLEVQRLADGELLLRAGDRIVHGHVRRTADAVEVTWEGRMWRLERATPVAGGAEAGEAPAGRLLAPMSGRVVAVSCRKGQQVSAGEALVLVEAMKMEHRIEAPFAGTVKSLAVAEGDQVDIGQPVAELEPEEGP